MSKNNHSTSERVIGVTTGGVAGVKMGAGYEDPHKGVHAFLHTDKH